MGQSVLVHADVNKGGHLGQHAFQENVGARVADFFHALLEGGGGEFWARIPARLFQLLDDVGDVPRAKFFVGRFGWRDGFQRLTFTGPPTHVLLDVSHDRSDHRLGFRVHSGGVQWSDLAHGGGRSAFASSILASGVVCAVLGAYGSVRI